MKRFVIAAIILALIGAVLYFINQWAADKASIEIDAILRPKLEAAGAQYESLSVNPAARQLILEGVTMEDGIASAEVLSVTTELEDLLAAAEGDLKYLHGLSVELEGFEYSEYDEAFNLASGQLDIDGTIDLKTMMDAPEVWLQEFFSQEEAAIDIKGNNFTMNSKEIAEELGIPSSMVRLEDMVLGLHKSGDDVDAQIELNSRDLGNISISANGDEQTLGSFTMEISEVAFKPERDMSISIGSSTLSMTGDIPLATIEEEAWEQLMQDDNALEWSISVRDFIVEGAELMDEGLPGGRLSIGSLDHAFKFSGNTLSTTFDFRSNMADGNAELKWDIQSFEEMAIDVNTMEISLDNVMPELRMLLSASPLKPVGDDGYSFSYTGPLSNLIGGR